MPRCDAAHLAFVVDEFGRGVRRGNDRLRERDLARTTCSCAPLRRMRSALPAIVPSADRITPPLM